jgi:hypothetical protein
MRAPPAGRRRSRRRGVDAVPRGLCRRRFDAGREHQRWTSPHRRGRVLDPRRQRFQGAQPVPAGRRPLREDLPVPDAYATELLSTWPRPLPYAGAAALAWERPLLETIRTGLGTTVPGAGVSPRDVQIAAHAPDLADERMLSGGRPRARLDSWRSRSWVVR